MNQRRLIVVGVIYNQQGEVLLCKMPLGRGVFPGQWGLPGGGIEDGELAEAALRREIFEEVGLAIEEIKPLFFTDGTYTKSYPDGTRNEMYMIFLIYTCRAASAGIKLNDEFEVYDWVRPDALSVFDVNIETRKTFQRLGLL
jgi:nucleoside triphosphatase